jgi:hypothetical protein
MKAYTDGTKVYTVDSVCPGGWKHIMIYKLTDWQEKRENAPCWVIESNNPIYKVIKINSWASEEDAEKALIACAKEFSWKKV